MDDVLEEFAAAAAAIFENAGKSNTEVHEEDASTQELAGMLDVPPGAPIDPALLEETLTLDQQAEAPAVVKRAKVASKEPRPVDQATSPMHEWCSADEDYVPVPDDGSMKKKKRKVQESESTYEWSTASETYVVEQLVPIVVDGTVRKKHANWNYVRASLSDSGHELSGQISALRKMVRELNTVVETRLMSRGELVPLRKGPYVYQTCLFHALELDAGSVLDTLHKKFEGGAWKGFIDRKSLNNLSTVLMRDGGMHGLKAGKIGNKVYFYLG